MSNFSFLAVPNVGGMRLWRYIQIFGIVLLFGTCLFFVIYFRLIYRRKKALVHQLDIIDHQTQDLGKQLLIQKIQKSSGKTKLILFIEYLEKFVTTDATDAWPVQAYANLSELLLPQWFTHQEVEEYEQVLYSNVHLSKQLENRLTTMIDSLS